MEVVYGCSGYTQAVLLPSGQMYLISDPLTTDNILLTSPVNGDIFTKSLKHRHIRIDALFVHVTE